MILYTFTYVSRLYGHPQSPSLDYRGHQGRDWGNACLFHGSIINQVFKQHVLINCDDNGWLYINHEMETWNYRTLPDFPHCCMIMSKSRETNLSSVLHHGIHPNPGIQANNLLTPAQCGLAKADVVFYH